jgi:dephospho-CoA kinase
MRLLVGLTGGIGSGKSEVGKIFDDLGAFLIDADELAHEVTEQGSDGFRRIAARWPRVIGAKGDALDRRVLADIIFADPQERAELNAIVHPLVRALMRVRCEHAPSSSQIIIYEAPLLFEAEVYREMDANVLVIAPLEERIARLMKRNLWDREHVARRIAAQIKPEEAEKLATHTIVNEGTLVELRTKTEQLYGSLLEMAHPWP